MQFQIFLASQVRDQANELIKQGYVIILWFEIKSLRWQSKEIDTIPLSKIFCDFTLLTVDKVHTHARL